MCNVIVLLCVFCLIMRTNISLGYLAGDPLFLTPLLEQNNVEKAQRQARVNLNIGKINSYSGFFTINETCSSHLFFWFFQAEENWREAPVILRIQGGPGYSSMWAIFLENGPLIYLDHSDQTFARGFSWNIKNNLLFIDYPIGTGFSFSAEECYAQDEEDIGRDLYSVVIQFFQLFPELRSNKFYIFGEYYTGYFIPLLGHTIHRNDPTASVKINLSGMMVGKGWMVQKYQEDLTEFLHKQANLDDFTKNIDQWVKLMRNEEFRKASEVSELLYDYVYLENIRNVTLQRDLDKIRGVEDKSFEKFIQLPRTRRSIHVGYRHYYGYNEMVLSNFVRDLVIPIKPLIEELLEHYPMVFYTSEPDNKQAYQMVDHFLKTLEWSGQSQFQRSPTQKWCMDDRQVRHFKGAHNLHFINHKVGFLVLKFNQALSSYLLANSITSDALSNPLHGLSNCK